MTGLGVPPCTICHAKPGEKCDPGVHAQHLAEREAHRNTTPPKQWSGEWPPMSSTSFVPAKTLREATSDFAMSQVELNHAIDERFVKLERDVKRNRLIVSLAVVGNVFLAVAQGVAIARYTQAADVLLDALQALSTLSA